MIHSTQAHGFSVREQEYLEGWQRAVADLDNFKKRMTEEQNNQRARAREEVIESMLSLAENFQSIVNHIPAKLAKDNWAQGVTHVSNQFEQILKDNGVSIIRANNREFNPALHEAIETIKDKTLKSGMVIEVIQPGYRMGESVIRPAKVKVAA